MAAPKMSSGERCLRMGIKLLAGCCSSLHRAGLADIDAGRPLVAEATPAGRSSQYPITCVRTCADAPSLVAVTARAPGRASLHGAALGGVGGHRRRPQELLAGPLVLARPAQQ